MSALWIPTSWEGWTWQVVDFSQVQAYPLPRKPLFAVKCTTHIVFYLSDRISGSNCRHDGRAHRSTYLCAPIESVRKRYWLLKPPEVDAVYVRPCRVEGEGGMKRGGFHFKIRGCEKQRSGTDVAARLLGAKVIYDEIGKDCRSTGGRQNKSWEKNRVKDWRVEQAVGCVSGETE